ncbi:MAG: sulfotransferase family 2 domain-containing protein [Deltaproteobacteria bacterium]|nr:sulfotransferase family 2 domain-containing protein [Deltaproteobacteria bacterium]
MKPRTVILHHVPKCAGTTLNDIAIRQYSAFRIFSVKGDKRSKVDFFKNMLKSEQSRFQLVLGHRAIRLADACENPIVFTMFREPVKRVISLYYYIKEKSVDHPARPMVNKYNLETFFRKGLDKEWSEFRNGQFGPLAEAVKSSKMFGNLGNETVSPSELRKVLKRYAIVGLLEYFDESLLLYAKHLGWCRPLYYTKKNVVSRKEPPSEALLEIIRERNAMDIALYNDFRKDFEATIRAQESDFHQRLKQFRSMNQLLGPIYTQTDRLNRIFVKLVQPR